MKYYIAYGSNLSMSQMQTRCPDAISVGTALLKDWCLRFRLHATIEPKKGCEVPVGVWLISEKDERSLDLYEGYPRYYTKRDIQINLRNFTGHVRNESAMVYVMQPGRGIMPPYNGYYDVIEEGYSDFGLNDKPLRDALKESVIMYDLGVKDSDLAEI